MKTPSPQDVLEIIADGFDQNPEFHTKGWFARDAFGEQSGGKYGFHYRVEDPEVCSVCVSGAITLVSEILTGSTGATKLRLQGQALDLLGPGYVEFNDSHTAQEIAGLCRSAAR